MLKCESNCHSTTNGKDNCDNAHEPTPVAHGDGEDNGKHVLPLGSCSESRLIPHITKGYEAEFAKPYRYAYNRKAFARMVGEGKASVTSASGPYRTN